MVISVTIGRILIEELGKVGIKADIFDQGVENGIEYVIITLNSGSSYRAEGLESGFLVWCPADGGDDDWEYESIYKVATIIKQNESIDI